MKKIFKSKIFIAFLLSFVLGSLIVIPNMILGRGIFSLVADYNNQQVPFNMLMTKSIKEGSFLWTWYNELGSNFIGTFSFYNLFSPFSLFMYLFPASLMPYLNGIFMILKYGVAGLTSYLFLKRYFKDYKYAIIGSLLYTFSGFNLNNMLFHFSDVVALFPLLLYTLDNYMYDNKKGWFLLVVFILGCTNWFFFVGQGVFFILYFIIKIICREYKFEFKKIGWLIFEGIVGLGMAMFVLVPSLLYMLGNPRIGFEWNIISMIKFPIINLIEILRAFILPNEVMNLRSFLTESNYKSCEIFLPLVGSLLVIGCLKKNYKKWYSVLFIVGFMFMIIPILNSSFFLFSGSYYARWFYMLILIMCLMSCKCLEDKVKLKVPVIINICLFILLFIGVLLYCLRINDFNIVYQSKYFYFMLVMGIISLVYTYIICNNKFNYRMLVIGIFVFVFIWGNYTTYYYKEKNLNNISYHNYLNISKVDKFDNVRTNSTSSCLHNLGCVGGFNNVKAFNTNINGSNFEFYKSIGYDRVVSTVIEDDRINDYLGVKYYISCGDDIKDLEMIFDDSNYKVYLNDDYLEFGFSKSKYMSNSEFNKLSVDDRINSLKDYVILSDKDISKYKDIIGDVVYTKNEFKFKNNGFSSIIDSSDDTIAIYTVPYDEGFKAYVNDYEVDIIKVDNGMMGIKINKGVNNIKFLYYTPGLNFGIVCSIISFIIYIGYLLFNKYFYKKIKE